MAATIIGILSNTKNGATTSTLHLAEDPSEFHNRDGRKALGKVVSTVYVGEYDCSALRVGQEVEIFFSQAFKSNTGNVFQQVKLIQPISK